MSFLQNTIALFYVIMFCLSLCSFTFARPTGVAEVSKVNYIPEIVMVLFQPIGVIVKMSDDDGKTTKRRVKRQGAGAGKFSESSKMSPTKVMQLILQMLKNTVTYHPVGGSHPMSVEVAKPTISLFKQRIIAFFFPDVGEKEE